MNILVIGAGGFIGKHLVEELRKNGDVVFEHTRENGNILDENILDQYKSIDCIYHLAAKTFVPDSWDKPKEFLNNNIIGLVNVLEYCKKNLIKIIFLSSYLYGQPRYLPIDEKHPCSAVSPYHLSKKLGEDICEFYSKYYGVDTIIIRPFNVYGEGQREEYLLTKIYKQIIDNTKDCIEVFDMQPKRDFIYIDDLINVLILLKDKVEGYQIYNIGSGCSYSVKEAIEIMQKEWHTNKRVIEVGIRRQNEVMDCVADITKLNSSVGNLKMHTLSEGIHKWHMGVAEK